VNNRAGFWGQPRLLCNLLNSLGLWERAGPVTGEKKGENQVVHPMGPVPPGLAIHPNYHGGKTESPLGRGTRDGLDIARRPRDPLTGPHPEARDGEGGGFIVGLSARETRQGGGFITAHVPRP